MTCRSTVAFYTERCEPWSHNVSDQPRNVCTQEHFHCHVQFLSSGTLDDCRSNGAFLYRTISVHLQLTTHNLQLQSRYQGYRSSLWRWHRISFDQGTDRAGNRTTLSLHFSLYTSRCTNFHFFHTLFTLHFTLHKLSLLPHTYIPTAYLNGDKQCLSNVKLKTARVMTKTVEELHRQSSHMHRNTSGTESVVHSIFCLTGCRNAYQKSILRITKN